MSAVLPEPTTLRGLPMLPRRRIVAIDALRGITFVVMLFVNFLAGAKGIPYGIHHMAANVDGMSLADIVFPAFLFVVGTSIPFSLNGRMAQGALPATLRQVCGRAFGLIVLGLFMVNAEEGYNETAMGMRIDVWALCFYGAVFLVWGAYRLADVRRDRLLRGAGWLVIGALALVYRSGSDGRGWMDTAWWGILGCIGWAYLVASLVYLAGRGHAGALALAVVACVPCFALLHGGSYDVVAMHATHTSIVLCGALAALLLFDTRQNSAAMRLRWCAGLGLVLAACAWGLHCLYPISKIGATPPWALYCAALCVALLAALYWLVELRGHRHWTVLVQPAAENPLVTYLLPIVLAAFMRTTHIGWLPWLMNGPIALVSAALFAAAVVAVVAFLNQHNVKLKL